MAFNTNQTIVAEYYIAALGRLPDQEGFDFWTGQLDAGMTSDDLMGYFLDRNFPEVATRFPEGQTNEEFISSVYTNTFGRDADAEGLAFWTAKLDTLSQTEVLAEMLAIAKDPANTVDAAHLAEQQALAEATLDDDTTTPVDPGTPGETFDLTDARDNLTGTENNDTFDASLDSDRGVVFNTLSSADKLDGGAGTDTLNAEIVGEFTGNTSDNTIDIQPTTTSIENVTFEVRDDDNTVVVDAKDMNGVEKIGSLFSDGDLTIENLTTLTNSGNFADARNTEEITITMDHTDNFNSDGDASDLTVYFDEDYLLAGKTTSTSQANYWLLDQDALDYDTMPLENIERSGVTLTIDGVAYTIEMDADIAASKDTWESFAAGLQAVIDASDEAAFDGLTVSVDESNTRTTFNDDGVQVTIPAIVITDEAGRDLVPTGFVTPVDASDAFNIFGRYDNEASVESNKPVTVNVELGKVGREGEGGNLVIGGKELDSNTPGTTEGNGIDTFNISVLGDESQLSNLGSIKSTNDALKTVNVETENKTLDTFASLTVRDAFGGTLDRFNANDFVGDLTIGSDTAAVNIDAFTATGGGDVTLTENIDGTEKSDFSVTTGNGSDDLNITLNGDAVDTVGTSFNLNAGNGNNEVTVDMQGAAVSVATTAALDNLSIKTGTGADEVTLIGGDNNAVAGVDGDADFNISTGAGSDFVYINSIDDSDTAGAAKGTWTVGTTTGAGTGVVYYKAELTVDFAGFESTVTINTTNANNFVATQVEINEAIQAAIAANPELAHLLTTKLGTGTQEMTIDSTVEGQNELTITIDQGTVVTADIASGDVSALNAGLVSTGTASNLSDDAAKIAGLLNGVTATEEAATDGGSADETAVTNVSTIDLGAGANDLVVLNSHASSIQTIDFSAAWGKVSVVNFETQGEVNTNPGAPESPDTTLNKLDFTAWLDDETSASGSTLSNTLVGATVATATTLGQNTVVAVDFTANIDGIDGSATNTFADLTDAQVLTALNADASFGTIIDAATVGTGSYDRDSIILIENTDNLGEYKAYNVTYSDNAATNEFQTATLIGTIDFGNSVDLVTANLA